MEIIKRNGQIVEFDLNKIYSAVEKAFIACGYKSMVSDFKRNLEEEDWTKLGEPLTVEKVQDRLEEILYLSGFMDVHKNFLLYRSSRALARESKNKKIFESIIATENNDVTRDNANMNSDTPAGMMMKFASETSKPFVDKYLIANDVKEAVKDNILYIHDKDYFPTRSLTCIQHPLDRILTKGFMAGHGEARPAKRIETAAILAAISMETIQNEMHGGQAIPAFDFYMAPYVRLTYQEEVEKIKELNVFNISDTAWEGIKNAQILDYTIEELPENEYLKVIQFAINNTVKRVHQAMESFIHNMNSIHSRGGNQVVFSSINYGTDTSAEGRCIMRELLLSTEKGVGNNATAIFPIQIWKMKAGVSVNPEDRNYDLYKLACRVSARRFFPNFLNLDASYNKDDNWNEEDPRRFEHEVATMGCRTRVYENRFGDRTSIGRGNLSFSTINLPKLAIKVAIEDGYLDGTQFNEAKNDHESKRRRFEMLKGSLKEYIWITAKQLDDRFKFQKKALVKQFPLLMAGMWNGSDKLSPNDTIESVINQGTLGIGFIGLAETLIAITGKHHGESELSQAFGLELISMMKEEINKVSEKYQHNYAVLATPAEGLSGKFTELDRKEFGIIPGVTDKNYYTNSNHIPVYYKCTAMHKAQIECPYHKYTTGGHIFYVEVDTDITKNIEVIDTINKIARDNDGGYISINHAQGRCNVCNFESNDPELAVGTECPHCHTKGSWDVLARITGYLVNTSNRWNSYKLSELHDRVQHV